MNNAPVMRCVNCRAHLLKNVQPPPNVEMMEIAVLIDGLAVNVLHHIKGQAVGRRSHIEEARDIRMFQRGKDSAFLLESMLLALVGGVAGLAAASLLQAVRISTTNFQTFSELAFSFELTPGVIVRSLLFALLMGLAGGVLPAAKAARMRIVDALRAS